MSPLLEDLSDPLDPHTVATCGLPLNKAQEPENSNPIRIKNELQNHLVQLLFNPQKSPNRSIISRRARNQFKILSASNESTLSRAIQSHPRIMVDHPIVQNVYGPRETQSTGLSTCTMHRSPGRTRTSACLGRSNLGCTSTRHGPESPRPFSRPNPA